MLAERGAIYNRDRAAQLRDFTSLRWRNITPTDIDAFVDFGGKAFVVIETKRKGNALPNGQRLAIERLIDALSVSGAAAIALIAEHEAEEDIDVSKCTVVEYRFKGRWRKPRSVSEVQEALRIFLTCSGLGYYTR